MKIIEARKIYSAQIQTYGEKKRNLIKQKEDIEKKMKLSEDGKAIYAKEAAILELTLDKVEKKQKEYRNYMEQLNQQWAGIMNMEASKQQAEASEEYYEDLAKIMEVARRLMEGAIVPPQDEQKLMEYSMELYQTAKSMGALERQKKREEYDSLWEKEEKKEVPTDPVEEADNATAISGAPEIVEVEQMDVE